MKAGRIYVFAVILGGAIVVIAETLRMVLHFVFKNDIKSACQTRYANDREDFASSADLTEWCDSDWRNGELVGWQAGRQEGISSRIRRRTCLMLISVSPPLSMNRYMARRGLAGLWSDLLCLHVHSLASVLPPATRPQLWKDERRGSF